jgi:glutamine cyclotransferase
VLVERPLAPQLFGEGLAAVGNHLLQLTWREGVAIVWDRDSLSETDRIAYAGEGWGLCGDGRRLYQSDGSDVLTVRHPHTFAVRHRVSVTLEGRALGQLNELECAEGWIYANLLGSDAIARIEPVSGRVAAVIDAAGLLTPAERRAADVLNGIAYDADAGVFLLTGKLWPRMFEVVFRPPR